MAIYTIIPPPYPLEREYYMIDRLDLIVETIRTINKMDDSEIYLLNEEAYGLCLQDVNQRIIIFRLSKKVTFGPGEERFLVPRGVEGLNPDFVENFIPYHNKLILPI